VCDTHTYYTHAYTYAHARLSLLQVAAKEDSLECLQAAMGKQVMLRMGAEAELEALHSSANESLQQVRGLDWIGLDWIGLDNRGQAANPAGPMSTVFMQ
jgi:hypothetical protein